MTSGATSRESSAIQPSVRARDRRRIPLAAVVLPRQVGPDEGFRRPMERLEHLSAYVAQWRRWQDGGGREQYRQRLVGFADGQQAPRRQLGGERAVVCAGPAGRVTRD